jgi:two-component system, OmpR family, sensor histidine kinase PhoQ
LQRLRDTLMKVHAQKCPEIELAINPSCQFRGDERDLLEVAGNVMDNACKYGRGRVWISAIGGAPGPLALVVEDNGAGIPVGEHAHILRRGTRLDQLGPGHGLGLAVAADIIESYRGSLEIEGSAAGGARVVIRFP